MGDAKREATCEERIETELASTLETLQAIWDQTVSGDRVPCDECAGQGQSTEFSPIVTAGEDGDCPGCDGEGYVEGEPREYADEEGGETNLYEYGLSFDYVKPGTFGDDQPEGYWRYQLSWGGPSDEFRFFISPGGTLPPYKITYHFMDWFDGAHRDISAVAPWSRGSTLMLNIWEFFEPTWGEHDYEQDR